MGFHATRTLDTTTPPAASARRETACSQKSSGGPIFSVVSGLRFYSPGVGRWDSQRSAHAKRPAPNAYTFVRNSPLLDVDADGGGLGSGSGGGTPTPGPVPPPSPPIPPGECRVYLCCRPAYGVASHCGIRWVGDGGDKRTCSARRSKNGVPSQCSPCCEPLVTCCTGDSGRNGACGTRGLDHALPYSSCTEVDTSAALCAVWDCFRTRMQQIHESCHVYKAWPGPNSNTAAWDALKKCLPAGVTIPDPPGYQPGKRRNLDRTKQCLASGGTP